MSAQFGLEIAALIDQHFPAALTGDKDQLAEVAVQLSVALGGVLALVYCREGPEAALRAVAAMTSNIAANACAIDQRARSGEIIGPIGH